MSSPLSRCTSGSVLLLGLSLLLPILWAQPSRAETLGQLDVIVFGELGHPAPGLVVRVGKVRAKTGRDGIARLRLPAGRHTLEVVRGHRILVRETVPVVWGEITEALIRLRDLEPPILDLEAPSWPRSEEEVPSETLHYGKLSGVIRDASNQAPIAKARVLVRGQLAEAETDAQGRYSLTLPAGRHTLSIVHPEYATATQRGVVVARDRSGTLDLELSPSAIQLETLRVSGYRLQGGLAALMEERRAQRSVTEVLGAEQISKSGDSNAAAALRRVTGLSVVDGKYVYVRGMGQRYSSTLLNGATLPSPEPEKRVVPLDLFPASLIESISVQKSYSVDLPGEFGGGTVRLETKGIPEERFFQASVSGGWRQDTTFEDGLSYRGSSTDWLGYDDGARSLPWPVRMAAEREPLSLEDPFTGEGYPLEVLEALGEIMPNRWEIRRKSVNPDFSVSASAGDRVTLFGRPLGFRAGARYGNSNQIRVGRLRAFGIGGEGELTPVLDYKTESYKNTVDVSGLASLGFEPAKGHELTLTGMVLRRTENETSSYQGLLGNEDTDIRVNNLDFLEQQLITSQLGGVHHLFDAAKVTWGYTYSQATRWQPDSRRTRFDLDDTSDRFLLSTRPEGNQRLYNDLTDQNHDLSAAVEVPLATSEKLSASVHFGGGYILREREAETRRFKFIHRGPRSLDPDVLARPIEQIFTPELIGSDGFSFEEITRATDSYEAQQTISAAFARIDLSILKTFEVSLGARVERSEQDVETFNLFARDRQSAQAELHETDFLPAVNLGWGFREDMQLRFGYSRTLSRPDFRELSTAPFDQVVGAGVFIGNPDLERTQIDNLDLRWEWYLSSDETISLGLFYKHLRNPIETVVLGGSNRTLTLANADEGRNLGIELDFRKRLGFFGPIGERIFVAGNVALIHSEVELKRTGIATERKRPLEGQSRYVLNLSVGYDDPERGISVALLYNVAGERIVGIGTLGLPDVYEQPFHQLDLVASYEFAEGWTFKGQLGNILDRDVRFTQDGQTVERYRKGRTVSLSISAEF